jgi:hypothetical protein
MTSSSPAEILHLEGYCTERRTDPRVPVDVRTRMKSLSPLTSMGPSTRARIVEISRSGMKIRVSREFQPGSQVQIIVGNTFYFGTVRHSCDLGGEFEAGINLTERIPSSLL